MRLDSLVIDTFVANDPDHEHAWEPHVVAMEFCATIGDPQWWTVYTDARTCTCGQWELIAAHPPAGTWFLDGVRETR